MAALGSRPAVISDNRQDDSAIDLDLWASLAADALAHEGVGPVAEMGLAFISIDEMSALNEQYMGKAGPTDVLAFPIDLDHTATARTEPPGGPAATADLPPMMVGDVLICPAVASLATNTGRSLEDEVALLVVHGVLHLLGHDHAEPDERAVMQQRERALLAAFYPGGVR